MKKNEFIKILKRLGKDYTIEGDNLTVGGSLVLHGTQITSLPDNLTVGGTLDLHGTQITSLPENLTVGDWLDLHGTQITSLPDNLTVGGTLDLEGTQITSLPENLTVGGSLDLRGTQITSLPENLTVGGSLYLRGTQITSLPDNLTVGGSLYLSGTQITSLPENLTVGDWLYLEDTEIPGKALGKVKDLPADFDIKCRNYVESKLVWQNGKYRVVDGFFCEVIKQHKNIIEVKIQNKKAYIFTKNGVNAHGKTIKQAYRDWLFKTSDRDVKQYEDLTLTTEKDLNYWVVCYRTITGACSYGTENYLDNNKEKYKNKMTLAEVFNATEGQYGHNTFVDFFKAAV